MSKQLFMTAWNHQTLVFSFASIVALLLIGCSYKENSSNVAIEVYGGNLDKSHTGIREAQIPGVGKALIKADGWEAPALKSEKKEGSEIKAQTIDGLEVSVGFTRYAPEFGEQRVAADIAANIGLGNLNIQNIKVYKVNGLTFAYSFQVNEVEIDKINNTIVRSRGILFDFTLYNEDGDGRFETLALSETVFNRTRRPHVPTWAARQHSR